MTPFKKYSSKCCYFLACRKDLEIIAKNLNNDKPNVILHHCHNIQNQTTDSLYTTSSIIIGEIMFLK